MTQTTFQTIQTTQATTPVYPKPATVKVGGTANQWTATFAQRQPNRLGVPLSSDSAGSSC